MDNLSVTNLSLPWTNETGEDPFIKIFKLTLKWTVYNLHGKWSILSCQYICFQLPIWLNLQILGMAYFVVLLSYSNFEYPNSYISTEMIWIKSVFL